MITLRDDSNGGGIPAVEESEQCCRIYSGPGWCTAYKGRTRIQLKVNSFLFYLFLQWFAFFIYFTP